MKFFAQIVFEDLSEPFGIITPSFLERNWMWLICLIVVFLFLCGIVRIFKPKPKAQVPVLVALQTLESLKNSELNDSIFAEAVSELIRIYLEKEYSLPALERTTPEFLALAADSGALNESLKNALRKILEYSDMAKFAKYSFCANEREELFNLSSSLLKDEFELQNKKKK